MERVPRRRSDWDLPDSGSLTIRFGHFDTNSLTALLTLLALLLKPFLGKASFVHY